MEEVKSPCVSICALHEGICQGCGRTQEEIAGWWDMTNEEKQQVLDDLEKRNNELFGD
jgi:uncharacterized protein